MRKQVSSKKGYLKAILLSAGGFILCVLLLNFVNNRIIITSSSLKNITPVASVTGKTVSEIKKEYPVVYAGKNDNGFEIYSFFERDSIAQRLFFFSGGVCGGQVIAPRSNKALELYLNYFNKYGIVYMTGMTFTMQEDIRSGGVIVQGNWRLHDKEGKRTNVFLVSGEQDNAGQPKAVYFMVTDLELSEWDN